MTEEEYGERHRARYRAILRKEMTLGMALNEDAADRVQLRSQRTPNPRSPRPAPSGGITLDLATRDFGVPSRTHAVARSVVDTAEFWGDSCWSETSQRRSTKAPATTKSVQPACPTHGTTHLVPFWQGMGVACYGTWWCRWTWHPGRYPQVRYDRTKEAVAAYRARLEAIADRCNDFWRPRAIDFSPVEDYRHRLAMRREFNRQLIPEEAR